MCSTHSVLEQADQNHQVFQVKKDASARPAMSRTATFALRISTATMMALCMSQFDCGEEEGGEYECKGQIFECDDGAGGPPGYEGFTCNKGAVIQFDCDASGSKEFNCGPFPEGSGTFECIPDEGDSFECSVEDIFNCLDFTCGESHICDVGTNGTGDFICWLFACGSGAQGDPPIENFDCKAHDKFGCLDSWEGAHFDCGANSTFECGDEEEKYECLNFTCGSPFSCSSGFTCGNRIDGNVYTYDCNDFICLAIVVHAWRLSCLSLTDGSTVVAGQKIHSTVGTLLSAALGASIHRERICG